MCKRLTDEEEHDGSNVAASGSDVVEVDFPSCRPALSIRPSSLVSCNGRETKIVVRVRDYTRATITHSISRSLPGRGKKGRTRCEAQLDDVASFHPFFRDAGFSFIAQPRFISR